jgi:hypothetical protein
MRVRTFKQDCENVKFISIIFVLAMNKILNKELLRKSQASMAKIKEKAIM